MECILNKRAIFFVVAYRNFFAFCLRFATKFQIAQEDYGNWGLKASLPTGEREKLWYCMLFLVNIAKLLQFNIWELPIKFMYTYLHHGIWGEGKMNIHLQQDVPYIFTMSSISICYFQVWFSSQLSKWSIQEETLNWDRWCNNWPQSPPQWSLNTLVYHSHPLSVITIFKCV